jgi:hypothetical protein
MEKGLLSHSSRLELIESLRGASKVHTIFFCFLMRSTFAKHDCLFTSRLPTVQIFLFNFYATLKGPCNSGESLIKIPFNGRIKKHKMH